jgi:peroxiredoxin
MNRNLISLFATLGGVALAACNQGQPAASQAPPPEPAPLPASAPADTPKAATLTVAQLGQPAPDFTLTDTLGKAHTLSELRGKTVVLEWFNPDCPFVRHAHTQGELKDMAKRMTGSDVTWLAVVSSAPGKQGHGAPRNAAARDEYALAHPVLLDETGQVGRAYGAEKTPHMYVVDPKGVLVYRGGIDNAPMGTVDDARPKIPGAGAGQHVNYVDAALEDLKAGRPLRIADTPAYGCSVKYAS